VMVIFAAVHCQTSLRNQVYSLEQKVPRPYLL
jgi:hypothetical protein